MLQGICCEGMQLLLPYNAGQCGTTRGGRMLIDDLKHLEHPTSQERLIIAYVLKHPDEVGGMTSGSLADATLTSPATITRLCKKLGLAGFSEFREQFVLEHSISAEGLLAQLNKPLIRNSYSAADVMNIMPRYYSRVIYETSSHLSVEAVSQALELLGKAQAVDLYGSGINHGMLERFSFQLQTLGKASSLFDTANIHMIECLSLESGHVSVIASHTGKNHAMVEAAQILSRRHLPVIGISSDPSSALAKASDVHLSIFTTPTIDKLSLVTYPVSLGYVTNLLYTALLPTRMAQMFDEGSATFYGREQEKGR